ncbi:MAG: TonB-dependent receptor plug domain-containing protein, partial [Flavobacteriaceae bacterium]|nr:TonB-dependent receptor plug domain-containing protein [Flavobacteriaceae bacterium]
MIVTATKTLRQLSTLPLPANLITKEEIFKSSSSKLSDIIDDQPGIFVVPDFGGGNGIQIQGLDSQYTLLLIDGAPIIGRQSGTLDLDRISIGNIEQVEIIKGSSSSLYGTDAI